MTGSLQQAVDAQIKSALAPYLRARGFKGSGRTYRYNAPSQGVVVVNVQASPWNADDRFSFAVNLAVVPALWWEWETHDHPKAPALPSEVWGLYRARLTEHMRGDHWWKVTAPEDADREVREVIDLLDRRGLPTVMPLLAHAAIVAAVQAQDEGTLHVGMPYALAVLRVGDASAEEIDELLGKLHEHAERVQSAVFTARLDRLEAWITERRRRLGLPGPTPRT